MRKDLIFSESLKSMKYLKPCLPKANLLDITLLLASISFIEIGLLY